MGLYDVADALVAGLLPGGVKPFWQAGQQPAPSPLAAAFGGAGAPAAAAPAAPRGKRMTMEVRLIPGQPPQPIKVVPGGVALYSRDLTAAKRAKRVGGTINKLFPRSRRAPAKRKR